MKAITLTQPWATLVAIGAKRIETRSWRTDYRGPLAIHAAKGLPKWVWNWYTQNSWARAALGIESYSDLLAMPRGAIVAITRLTVVQPVSAIVVDDRERAFGDYSAGRFAWLLTNIECLPKPIEAKGALGLWEWSKV